MFQDLYHPPLELLQYQFTSLTISLENYSNDVAQD